jgi:hypothetical protein
MMPMTKLVDGKRVEMTEPEVEQIEAVWNERSAGKAKTKSKKDKIAKDAEKIAAKHGMTLDEFKVLLKAASN